MMAEALGKYVQSKVLSKEIMGIKPTSSIPPMSVQQFVDDTILFGISSVVEA